MLGDVAEPACNQASSDFRFFHVALCLDIPFQFDSAFSAPILQKRGYIAMTTQIRWQWRQKKKISPNLPGQNQQNVSILSCIDPCTLHIRSQKPHY
ncbi:hypothetical protein EE612_008765 [Oryza sativa]|nr:hypothetical protein EE612_008765 [Oryza sativa]